MANVEKEDIDNTKVYIVCPRPWGTIRYPEGRGMPHNFRHLSSTH